MINYIGVEGGSNYGASFYYYKTQCDANHRIANKWIDNYAVETVEYTVDCSANENLYFICQGANSNGKYTSVVITLA